VFSRDTNARGNAQDRGKGRKKGVHGTTQVAMDVARDGKWESGQSTLTKVDWGEGHYLRRAGCHESGPSGSVGACWKSAESREAFSV